MTKVKILDYRVPVAPEDRTIPNEKAVPGRLYQTVGGSKEVVVMAVQFAAVDYLRNYPSGRAFIREDGSAWPLTSDRLLPLDGEVTWCIRGEKR